MDEFYFLKRACKYHGDHLEIHSRPENGLFICELTITRKGIPTFKCVVPANTEEGAKRDAVMEMWSNIYDYALSAASKDLCKALNLQPKE